MNITNITNITNMNTIDNIQLEKDWNEAAAIFGELCKEGESILVGWIKSDDEKFITIYTIERQNGKTQKMHQGLGRRQMSKQLGIHLLSIIYISIIITLINNFMFFLFANNKSNGNESRSTTSW